jgi:hypothetical protein
MELGPEPETDDNTIDYVPARLEIEVPGLAEDDEIDYLPADPRFRYLNKKIVKMKYK